MPDLLLFRIARSRGFQLVAVFLLLSSTMALRPAVAAVSGYARDHLDKPLSFSPHKLPAREKLAGTELITNGSFEMNGGLGTNQLNNWTVVNLMDVSGAPGSGDWFAQSGSVSPQNSFAVDPPTDLNVAAMTDQGGPGAHLLYQDITIPSGASSVSLNCDIFISNRATTFFVLPNLDFSGSPNQHARVDIMDPAAPPEDVGAGVLQNLFINAPGDPVFQPYMMLSADLSAYAGQTIRLRFAEVDNQTNFNMGVDNCSLMAVTTAPLIPQVYIDAQNDVGSEAAADSFTFALDIVPPPAQDIQVGIEVDPSSTVIVGEDVGPVPALIDVKAGETHVSFTIDVLDDAIDESLESLTLATLPGTGYDLVAPFSAAGFVIDDDGIETLSCRQVPTPEGARFTGFVSFAALDASGALYQPGFAQLANNSARAFTSDGLWEFFSSDQDLVAGRNADGSIEIFKWSLDSGMIEQLTDNQGNFAVLGVNADGGTVLARTVLRQAPGNVSTAVLPVVTIDTATGSVNEVGTPMLAAARQQGDAYLSHPLGGGGYATPGLTEDANWAAFRETVITANGGTLISQDSLYGLSSGALFDVSAGGMVLPTYMASGSGTVFGTTTPCITGCPTALPVPLGAIQIVFFDPLVQAFQDSEILPPGATNFAMVRATDSSGLRGVIDEEGPLAFNETRNPEGNEEIYLLGDDFYGPIQVTASNGDSPICFRFNDPADPASGCASAADNAFAQISRDGNLVFFSSDRDIVGANPDRSHELFRFDPVAGKFAQITDTDSPIFDWLTGLGAFAGPTQIPVILSVNGGGDVIYVARNSEGVLAADPDGSLVVRQRPQQVDAYDCR